MTGSKPRRQQSGLHRGHWALAIALVALLYVAQAFYYTRVLVPSGDMIQYLVAGALAAKGEISLYDDRLPGNRVPLPFYVLGLTQVLAGPSLLAARWLNVGFGLLTLLLTAALARRLAGDGTGILAALFLATQGVVVAYYSYEGYPAFAAFCFMGALFVLLGGNSPRRRMLGIALIGLLFFVRTNLWPAIPFLLGYALWRARGLVERASLVAVVTLPPLLFFAWDPRHLKLLAYVPVLRHLVAPLGYVSAFVLDDRQTLPLAAQLWQVARLARRYEFWVLATVVLLALLVAWQLATRRVAQRSAENPTVVLLAALLAYMLTAQFLIFSWNWKWVGIYFLPFAPLVPILLGVGFSWLLAAAPPRSWARRLLVIVLGFLLLPPLYLVRNPLLPTGELLAKDPFGAAHRAAAHLRRAVPLDAKVFFYGWNVAYYLSGLSQTYLQQVYSDWHLAARSVDVFVLRRSGFVPVSDLARWLSVEADYAVIDPAYIEAHRDQFRASIQAMETLLGRHFEKIDTVGEYRPITYDVYRRKGRGAPKR